MYYAHKKSVFGAALRALFKFFGGRFIPKNLESSANRHQQRFGEIISSFTYKLNWTTILYFVDISADLNKLFGLLIDNFNLYWDCVDSLRIMSKMLADARFKFALECLKTCSMMEPKTNCFFSPHLLYHNLLLAYFGALYDLEFTLRRVLHIPAGISKYNIEEYYSNKGVYHFCYIKNGWAADSYTCRIYFKIIINNSKGLYVETMNLLSASNSVKEYNFNIHPDRVRNFVNNVVTCTTQSCIQNLLPPNSIDNDTEIIMFNTIYFKGQFDDSYDDYGIRKQMDTDIAKQVIYKSEQLHTFIIEVPCKERKISTFFFYPPITQSEFEESLIETQKSMIKLIEQLTTEKGSQELRDLLEYGLPQQMDTVFPFLTNIMIEHDLPIYELLDRLGIPDFTPDLCTAELHDFSSDSVKLGDAVHRVSINITKSGIVATASNVFFTYNSCKHARKVPETVNVMSPCISLIYDRLHHNILFCGMLWEN